ncbi:MAG: GNAT family N-acetyltransferase [Clostridiales bacterium]|nr:GNAT family N-acetyltransferase [Clostridiales bacterium]
MPILTNGREPSMEYRYTRLDPHNVDDILALQARCWIFDRGIFTLSSRALVERAFQFQNFAFGAFWGDEMAGFITCSMPTRRAGMNLGRHLDYSDEQLDRVAHLNAMVIAPEHRRRGVGSRLFSLAMAAFPSHAQYIMTTTRLENALARSLLEQRGFSLARTIEAGGETRAIYLLQQTSHEETAAVER